jgi:hypothetical protein
MIVRDLQDPQFLAASTFAGSSGHLAWTERVESRVVQGKNGLSEQDSG